MKLTGESKIFLSILAITAVIIGLASVVLTKPAPTFPISELVTQTTHTKGPTESKVVLVEFSDFQCPACLAVKPTLDAILAKHGNTIRFAYRHFPLDQHPFAKKAAAAAEAAGKQGKFFEMYDALFANQAKLSDTLFSELATNIGLDITRFQADMNDKTIETIIQTDISDGTRFGVNATPTFFLNGKKLELSSFDDLSKAVDEAVANSK